MKIINKLTLYILIFTIIIILLAGVFTIGFLYYRKKKSQRLKEEDTDRSVKEQDAEKFVPLDDITDDMIIASNRKRFVAVIRCRGYDFYTANEEEKLRTKNNYKAFISALTSRITYRMYGEDINMDHTMEIYQDTYAELQEIAFNETESYKEARIAYDEIRGSGSQQEEELEKYLLKSTKKIKAYEWRLAHLESEMRYINRVSGPATGRQRLIQTYVVDWQNHDNLISGILTEEQLHKKAIIELDKIVRNKIRQLNDAGVKAYRCKTGELIDMWHRHYHPISGNRFTFDHLNNSTYYDMVSTTNALEEMDVRYEAELIEEMMMGVE